MQCPGVRKGFLAAVEDLYMGCAGGVTVSFFEWVQNLQNFRWEEEEVNKRLDLKMTEAFAQIWEISRQKKLPLRTAAFVKALQSVTRAHLHSAPWLLCYQASLLPDDTLECINATNHASGPEVS